MASSESLYGEDNDLEDDQDVPEAEEAPADEDVKKPVKPKRVVRNPQPKLNPETLKGKKGLTALPSYFERVKYKGRGHEEKDLSVILKTYEYWCHRLFPKYPFDECIAKIEKLGSKRAVVTHVKKIRLNMIYEDEPVLNNADANSDLDENVINENPVINDVDNADVEVPQLTEEQQEQIRLNREKAKRIRREKLQKARELAETALLGESENFINEFPSQNSYVDGDNLTFEAETPNTDQSVELTEEQQERIKQNKERAERLRQDRLKQRALSSQNDSSINILSKNLTQLSSAQSLDVNVQQMLHSPESSEVVHTPSSEFRDSEDILSSKKGNSLNYTVNCNSETQESHIDSNFTEHQQMTDSPQLFRNEAEMLVD